MPISTAQLESIAHKLLILIIETELPEGIKGYYLESIEGQNYILLSNALSPTERRCVLAEELGHCMMNVGTPRGFSSRKQELTGRRWAYKQLVPIKSIRNAYISGEETMWYLAQALDVTEEFLREAIEDYKSRGLQVFIDIA